MKKSWTLALAATLLYTTTLTSGCHDGNAGFRQAPEEHDGVFIHISTGPEDPHRVLMGLKMATLMAQSRPALVYFDIQGVHAVLKDAPDLAMEPFHSSHTAIRMLLDKGMTVCVCPGCLKAAGKTAEDVMEGVQIANKDRFFNFTKGRILTLDY